MRVNTIYAPRLSFQGVVLDGPAQQAWGRDMETGVWRGDIILSKEQQLRFMLERVPSWGGTFWDWLLKEPIQVRCVGLRVK